jgi:hypothetical protein
MSFQIPTYPYSSYNKIGCKTSSNIRVTLSTVIQSAGCCLRNLKLLSFTILKLDYFHKQVQLYFITEFRNYLHLSLLVRWATVYGTSIKISSNLWSLLPRIIYQATRYIPEDLLVFRLKILTSWVFHFCNLLKPTMQNFSTWDIKKI